MTTQPKERPILFSGPMVSAILEGRKTQTRRIVKHRESRWEVAEDEDGPWPYFPEYVFDEPEPVKMACPHGDPGDRLWVRETHARIPGQTLCNPHYMADGPRPTIDERHDAGLLRVYPSIHMPRWASRITLEVTAVRCERLHEINEADAASEGVRFDSDLMGHWNGYATAIGAFRSLWEGINGPESWQANPWVWVVSFTRVEE